MTAHDPIRCRCEPCRAILRRSLNQLADLELGPKDADELIRRLRRIAAGNLRVVA